MVDETPEENTNGDDATKPDAEEKSAKPRKRAVKPRKTTDPTPSETTAESNSNSDPNGSQSSPGTGDMNWDKAKETLSEVDWDSRGENLLRFGLMLLAMLAVGISQFLIYTMAITNFIYVIITCERLSALSEVSSKLIIYVDQLLSFISYRTDGPVFPFAPFPETDNDDD